MAQHTRIGPALLSLMLATAAAGCSSNSDAQAETSTSPTSSPQVPVTSVVVDSDSVSSTRSEPTTVVPTEYVNNCMAYVQFGAVTGNPILLSMWNDAGQDVATLAANCEALGLTSPDVFEGMTEQWIDIETYLAAAAPTPAPPPEQTVPENTTQQPPSTEPRHVATLCDPNYTGCVLPSSDVDCEGEGDGPTFLSEPVGVVGEDIYELDVDGNRVACE